MDLVKPLLNLCGSCYLGFKVLPYFTQLAITNGENFGVRRDRGVDLGLVPARKKERPCGWHLFVVPLKGHVLFGGNNPRANKAARKSTEKIAQQHLSAQS